MVLLKKGQVLVVEDSRGLIRKMRDIEKFVYFSGIPEVNPFKKRIIKKNTKNGNVLLFNKKEHRIPKRARNSI